MPDPPPNESSVLKPRIDVFYADGLWRARSDDPGQGSIGGTAEIAVRAVADWTGVQLPSRHPKVAGKCPACGASALFLGSGGHVTCGLIGGRTGDGCTDPTLADRILHGEEG